MGSELAQGLLSDYGIIALLAIFIIEGAMLLYFAPSESLVPVAVVLLADSTTEIVLIVSIAVVGATIGQYVLFIAAKRGGREYLLSKRWFRISDQKLTRFDRWFEQWGIIAIPASNTLLFTRGMLTVPAGVSKMNDTKFIIMSAVGTLVFESILAAMTVGLLG